MHAAAWAAGEIPDQPGVNVAKDCLAVFRILTQARDVIQQPVNFGAGKISGQGQAGFFAQPVLTAIRGQLVAIYIRAHILPYDGGIIGVAGRTIPDQRSFALVCDSYSSDVRRGQVGFAQSVADDLKRFVPYFEGIMLNPAGPGEELLVFFLICGNDCAAVIENDAAGAGRALIDGKDVLGHKSSSLR